MSIARYLLPLSAVFTLACGADPATPAAADRLGRYQLLRINGKPLPGFVTEGSAARIDFLSGAVHLNPDGTFVDSTEAKISPHGGMVRFNTDVATGRYRVSHDTVFFDSDRVNERYFMVYASEQSLLQELGGSVLLYTR
jgi:hypothetical protein